MVRGLTLPRDLRQRGTPGGPQKKKTKVIEEKYWPRSSAPAQLQKNIYLRHSGVVYLEAIISAKGTEDRGFESRQVVRFLGLNALIAMLFFVT
jgi:hypothetical protein